MASMPCACCRARMSIRCRRVVSLLGVSAIALVQAGVGRSDPGLAMPSGTPDALLGKVVSGFAGRPVDVACGGDANSLFLGLTMGTAMWLDEPLVCAPV